MKYLGTINNINNFNKLKKYDGFVVGNKKFSSRLTNSFSHDEINELIYLTKSTKQEVFLSLNKMYVDAEFNDLEKFLKQINLKELTGIIVSDYGVVQLLVDLQLNHLIVWNGETLSTNIFDFNFLNLFNIFGAFTAKEITIKDIMKIAEFKKHNLFLIGHGHLSMFYSKRKLIYNFKDKYQLTIDNNKSTYKLIESNREEKFFPILEDEAGTHIYRADVTNSFKFLKEIKKNVDYFIIDSIFKDDEYLSLIINLYKNGYDDVIVKKIQTKYQETWDLGFYEQKTVYLKEIL